MSSPLYQYHRFRGMRKVFLDCQCTVYFMLREKTIKKELAMSKVEAYVVVIVTMYLENFPWYMPEEEEPQEGVVGVEPKGPEAEKLKHETIRKLGGWVQTHMEFAWRFRTLTHSIRIFEDMFGIAICPTDHACNCKSAAHSNPRLIAAYDPEAFVDLFSG